MPDEHTNWERVSTRSKAPSGFSARKTTITATHMAKDENPYREEAARERAIMMWGLAVIVLLGIIAVLAWFVFLA